jgi:hypothetical protein
MQARLDPTESEACSLKVSGPTAAAGRSLDVMKLFSWQGPSGEEQLLKKAHDCEREHSTIFLNDKCIFVRLRHDRQKA